MNIDVLLSIDEIAKTDLKGKTAVIIDVLRASSTLITALGCGVSRIIPIADREKARSFFASLPAGTAFLGGEYQMQRIPGFDLGNSPGEYEAMSKTPSAAEDHICSTGLHSANRLQGKTLVLSTSNGTKAFDAARNAGAENITIACFLNARAAAEQIMRLGIDTVIICSGFQKRFALEDMLGAGAVIDELKSLTDSTGKGSEHSPDQIFSDAAKAAVRLYRSYPSPAAGLADSIQSERLAKLGKEKDVEFCARLNYYDITTVCRDGILYPDR